MKVSVAGACLAVLLSASSAFSAGADEWAPEEWEAARSLSPLPPPPRDPSNALSGRLEAARLGHRLFFDPRLSPRGVACATCHLPEKAFADGLAVPNTLAPLHRNTMTILNVGHYRWLTWDGARDSLWHQAVGPIESPKEMGSSRLHVVRAVMTHHGPEFARLIQFPPGWEALWPRLPAEGKPGDPAFDALPEGEKDAVHRVFVGILKILAAYEERVASGRAPFDDYVAGRREALSSGARRGFKLFLRFQCNTCHNTPLFSDDEFHNLGLPPKPGRDEGRAQGLAFLKEQLFRGTGPYADGPPVVRAEDYRPGKALIGSFRTPSLREVERTGPYGHNGAVPTLEEWLDHYVNVTKLPPGSFVGVLDPSVPAIGMTPREKQDLIAFLRSLSSRWESGWTRPPAGMAPGGGG